MTALSDFITELRQNRISDRDQPVICNIDAFIAALEELGGGATATPQNASNGRLTLTSDTPVLSTDVTAAATLFLTPYNGNQVAVWDGSNFTPVTFTQLSLDIGALAADTVYDIIVSNPAAPALSAVAWATATARATALTRVNGVPTVNAENYLGTIATNAASRCNMMFAPAAANGGSGNRLDVWNMYNRVDVCSVNIDNAASYAYKVGLRRKNNNANNDIIFVCGLAEDMIEAINVAEATISATTVIGMISIGYDAVAIDAQSLQMMGQPPGGGNGGFISSLRRMPTIGRHSVIPLEEGNNGAGTITWQTTMGAAGFQEREGFSLKFRM